MKQLRNILLGLCLSLPLWAASAVNVNTASAEEIAAALKGVGMSKAQAIVAYREQNGAFEHADELVNVKGIGLKLVDMNRELIVVTAKQPAGD